MKLLLDEMYPPEIAVQLRRRGHDVVAVVERPKLPSTPDAELFELAASENRTVVTNDAPHFIELFNGALTESREHAGVLLTSDHSLPRTKAGIGAMVRALDHILREHPEKDALANQLRWVVRPL